MGRITRCGAPTPRRSCPPIRIPKCSKQKPLSYEPRFRLRPWSPIQTAVAGVSKGIPLEFDTLAQQVSDSTVQERLLTVLSSFFGGLALLLAMVGFYGALELSGHAPALGIRNPHGAGRGMWREMALVMRDVALILGGVTAGVLISLAATRAVASLFGLGARDPLTLPAAATLLFGVACLAGYIPARRAARVDPTLALRYE